MSASYGYDVSQPAATSREAVQWLYFAYLAAVKEQNGAAMSLVRTPEYEQLFSGDPTWVTESLGGIGRDGRPLVTRTSFRYLQTLHNLGPAPEPNMTVFWSPALPEGFKKFCAQVSLDTSAIQYESDDLIRPYL